MDKGALLNQRVWSLFEKAGFETNPNSQSPKEFEVNLLHKNTSVDLYARDKHLKVSIIGSNKSGRRDRWSEHVTFYKELGRIVNADKILFVTTGSELDDPEKKIVQDQGMCIWSEEDLGYYEALAEAIKWYAKYEILHALGVKTKEQKDTHKVLALRLRQPTALSPTELFMFSMSPERLLKTCVIYRRAQGNADAYQRMLRKNRLPKIRKFVSQIDSLLPTDIILHFSNQTFADELKPIEFRDLNDRPITLSSGSGYDPVVLNIPMEYASLELIDGQHRLYGFVEAAPATKQDFSLVVLGIKGLDPKQRRDTFVAINDNSRRMDANLVSFLKYTSDDVECQKDSELMAIRVVVDLNRQSPFKKSIKLLDIAGKQKITLKGFSGYDLRGLLAPRGLLRKYYPNNLPSEFVQTLRLYFSIIRSVFGKEWKSPDTYIVATNRGISAFLKLLKSILKTEKQVLDHAMVLQYMKALKSGMKTWDFEDLKKTYVGSQGWKDFHRDMVYSIRTKYPKFRE